MAKLLAAAIRQAWEALSPSEGEVRAAFERECATHNLRSLRIVAPVLALLQIVVVVVLVTVPMRTTAQEVWSANLGRIEACVLPMTVVLWLVAHITLRSEPKSAANRPSEAPPAPRAEASRGPLTGLALGDLATATFLVCGALMSANVQRVQPNQNAFTILSLIIALVLRARPRVYVPMLLGGALLVAASVVHFVTEAAVARAQLVALGTVTVLALVTFAITRTLAIRATAAKLQIERLNASLEDRVAEQVEEITRRAKEIEQLNVQLNRQVRERSRELSMALARLAMDHAAIPAGTILGDRVEIEQRIGEGGMGAVYRARDLVTSSAVAVKVVQAGSATELDGLYRFLREAQALATLTHPAIVRSFHVDVADDGRLFQVMELIVGETLQTYLDRHERLPQATVARLGAVLADALANAHAAGVVHRDVKPANVMRTAVSPGIKLLDFGVSKLRDVRAANGSTGNAVIGTPEFLSPEQISDPDHVTDRADVYSLGLVLYLSLTGRAPYESTTSKSWLIAHVAQSPEPVAKFAPDVDPALAAIVMACLHKSPEERPSAESAARALAGIADRLGCPALEHAWERPSLPQRPTPDPPRTGVQRGEISGRRTLKVVR